jgi:cell division protein FtsL
MKDNSTLKIKNEIYHERDGRHLSRCVLGVIGGILIACGFAFAAHQHFSALQCSARNVEMQRERERLKTEHKRLIFEREMATSPSQLETRARKIGLQNLSVAQINRFDEIQSRTGEEISAVQIDSRAETTQKVQTADLENQKARVN